MEGPGGTSPPWWTFRMGWNQEFIGGGLLLFVGFVASGPFVAGTAAWLQGFGFLLMFLGWFHANESPGSRDETTPTERARDPVPGLRRDRTAFLGVVLVLVGYVAVGAWPFLADVNPSGFAVSLVGKTGWVLIGIGFLLAFTTLTTGHSATAGLLILVGITLGPNSAGLYGVSGLLVIGPPANWTLAYFLHGLGFLIGFRGWGHVRWRSLSGAMGTPGTRSNILERIIVTLGPPLVLGGYVLFGSSIYLVPASRYVVSPIFGLVVMVGGLLAASGFLLTCVGLAVGRPARHDSPAA